MILAVYVGMYVVCMYLCIKLSMFIGNLVAQKLLVGF